MMSKAIQNRTEEYTAPDCMAIIIMHQNETIINVIFNSSKLFYLLDKLISLSFKCGKVTANCFFTC